MKAKLTQYQGQMLQNQFSVLYYEGFCDLCAMRMLHLRLKGILVDTSVSKYSQEFDLSKYENDAVIDLNVI